MKRMVFGVTLFFGGLFGLMGLYLVAVQSPYMVGSLTEALADLGLIVHAVVAWVFLLGGLFLCIYEAFTREANERQRAQEKSQVDTKIV